MIVKAGSAIPIPETTDLTGMKVVEVTDNEVTLTARLIGNSSFGGCLGGISCHVQSNSGEVSIRLGRDSRGAQNGVVLTVVGIANGTAVLQVAPSS